MAAGPITQIADLVQPEKFTAYLQQRTEVKSRLVQSGALTASPMLSNLLAGGGITFHVPSFRDLDDDADRVATETAHSDFTGGTDEPDPFKIQTSDEIAVRLYRTGSWSSARLAAALAGEDPMAAIGDLVSDWWVRRLQDIWISTMIGVFADNAAAATGTDTHTVNDMTVDVSDDAAGSFSLGVTNFTTEAFIDATQTMGDSKTKLSLMMVHSAVGARMEKNDLIDFEKDSQGQRYGNFRGLLVIEDDRMPFTGSVYDTWIFGMGATVLGTNPPPMATAVERKEGAGNGAGQDVLWSRQQYSIHPVGHAYIGAASGGGPANTVLDNATSWSRVYPQRKQIHIARLVTREA